MSRRLPRKDVVIIGLGWTGSIIANELTDQGLDVIAIERGPWRDAPTDFAPSEMQDELRYRVRHELFLRPDQLTFTFRNKTTQTALPIRSWGAFMAKWANANGWQGRRDWEHSFFAFNAYCMIEQYKDWSRILLEAMKKNSEYLR